MSLARALPALSLSFGVALLALPAPAHAACQGGGDWHAFGFAKTQKEATAIAIKNWEAQAGTRYGGKFSWAKAQHPMIACALIGGDRFRCSAGGAACDESLPPPPPPTFPPSTRAGGGGGGGGAGGR